jgi:hypothetical protein
MAGRPRGHRTHGEGSPREALVAVVLEQIGAVAIPRVVVSGRRLDDLRSGRRPDPQTGSGGGIPQAAVVGDQSLEILGQAQSRGQLGRPLRGQQLNVLRALLGR